MKDLDTNAKDQDIEDAKAFITMLVALMVAIAKAFEEIQMGQRIPTLPRPLRPEQPQYCKEAACGKQLPSSIEREQLFKNDWVTWCIVIDGFCSFECQDWHRQMTGGVK